MLTNPKYEVRFTLYHYNSGDGRNGVYAHEETFSNLVEADCFRKRLLGWLSNHDESAREFVRDYCWDGYVKSVDGIYEVTEKKLV